MTSYLFSTVSRITLIVFVIHSNYEMNILLWDILRYRLSLQYGSSVTTEMTLGFEGSFNSFSEFIYLDDPWLPK